MTAPSGALGTARPTGTARATTGRTTATVARTAARAPSGPRTAPTSTGAWTRRTRRRIRGHDPTLPPRPAPNPGHRPNRRGSGTQRDGTPARPHRGPEPRPNAPATLSEATHTRRHGSERRQGPPLSGGPCLEKSRRRPTLPGGYPPSTIGAGGLNCRVRNGNGCLSAAMATGNCALSVARGSAPDRRHSEPGVTDNRPPLSVP